MTLFLLGLAAAVIYTGSLYAWPFRPCSRCGGTGRNRGSNRRRYGTCKARRCDRGTVQRLGSKTVHRAVRSLAAYRRNSKDR
jgi:hypothetical protein